MTPKFTALKIILYPALIITCTIELFGLSYKLQLLIQISG